MAAAAPAQDLGPSHPEAAVLAQLDVLRHRRLVEARPAGPGLELRVRAEQLGAAGRAAVHAVVLDVDVFAGEGALGPVPAQDLVLLGRQPLAPLGVAELHLALRARVWVGSHASTLAGRLLDTVNRYEIRSRHLPHRGRAGPRRDRADGRGAGVRIAVLSRAHASPGEPRGPVSRGR